MKIDRPLIHLHGIQTKSLEKAKKLAYALNIIEEECGIHQVRITMVDPFICPWIDLEKLNETEMEKLLRELMKKCTL